MSLLRLSRLLHQAVRRLAKNDSSTIDSYRLPSQTSINEWEFKYDFVPKVSLPKVPPVSPEAVKQDIAQNKKQQVEHELFTKEQNSSIKVEANDAHVVHGGEHVSLEHEFLHDRGLDPVDSSKPNAGQPSKVANSHKYAQTSVNPEINEAQVNNLGERTVNHKTADSESPGGDSAKSSSASNPAALLGVLGLGGVAGYFFFNRKESK